MGVIGDITGLIVVVGIGGGVYYLVDDYRKNDCNSFIGSWQSRCIVTTAGNVVKGAVSGIRNFLHI